jgi:NADPH2:quinone reductase
MSTSRAVRFESYGDVDVLDVVEVPTPVPGPGQVVVEVRAAGINPGEATIRSGALDSVYPATFPSGEGSDLAGVIAAVGPDVDGVAVGDEVLGWTDERAGHATHVAVPADQVVAKPSGLSFEAAGALYVAGMAAVASIRAVEVKPGETIVVSGAAGGVGSIAVQLVKGAGATVVGIASQRNHAWLRELGVVPVAYADDPAETAARVRAAAPEGVDAWVDTFGGGYVDLALGLGVAPERINTIIDFEAVQEHGVRSDGTSSVTEPAAAMAELAAKAADGTVRIPVAATYPLAQVRDAYRELEARHTAGKIVLVP